VQHPRKTSQSTTCVSYNSNYTMTGLTFIILVFTAFRIFKRFMAAVTLRRPVLCILYHHHHALKPNMPGNTCRHREADRNNCAIPNDWCQSDDRLFRSTNTLPTHQSRAITQFMVWTVFSCSSSASNPTPRSTVRLEKRGVGLTKSPFHLLPCFT
jgi:hypothetical protein